MIAFKRNHGNRINFIIFIVLALTLNIAVIYPMIFSGYISDDSINSFAYGIAHEKSISILEFYNSINLSWMKNEGRFFPLAFYMYFLFFVIKSVVVYKISILIMVLINISLFGFFIKLLTRSTLLTMISLVLPSWLFQFRMPHDPILGFHWLLELVFLLTLSSLIFLFYFLKSSKYKYIFYSLSIAMYLISILIYEITYLFIVLHLVLILIYSSKKSLKAYVTQLFPYIMVLSIVGGISVVLRIIKRIAETSINAVTYEPNFDMGKYILTLLKQIYASFPLSYLSFNPANLQYLKNADRSSVIISAIFIILINFLIFRNLLKKRDTPFKTSYKVLLVIGISFLVLPNVLVALSPKYQQEIAWGYGYLPVYISYFGLIMILLSGILVVFKKIGSNGRKMVLFAFMIVSIILGILNFINNSVVVRELNRTYLYPREVIQNSIKGGLFSELPENSKLIVDIVYPWDVTAFYNIYSPKKLAYVDSLSNYTNNSVPATQYYLDYKPFNEGKVGYSIISRVDEISVYNSKVFGMTGNNFKIYISGEKQIRNLSISGYWASKDDSEKFETFQLTSEDLKLEESNNEGYLYSYTNNQKVFDIKSLSVNKMTKLTPSFFIKERSKRDMFLDDTNTENIVLHTGFYNKEFGAGIPLVPMTLETGFSIEALVNPGEKQVGYANIFGNHPGYNNFEGFVFQQKNNENNVFTLSYGDGRKFNELVDLNLIPGQVNYIVFSFDDKKVSIYLDGLFKKEVVMEGVFRNSSMPLYVGNWMNGDRPFSGVISELKISNQITGIDKVALNWKLIQESK
ncbi:LamG-like jellyroll fold domain-containing protein [Paenibacillus monticola]|uniref:LamG-like jellyroll fold domain-containing protein n=1 Tax=Paenibacillus monticola TaxID=2666075 RepID=A0A7X2H6C6_9BACL|nr:LamG-like jellyroll fold domain-containing protein [Paenibacillus monticola]MRN54371.1 hypothetical protein [Paenibacillus monticola]